MQLTNLHVLNVMQSLNIISQQKLPIQLAWKITTAIRSLAPFAAAIEESMKEIHVRYAIKDELGKFVEMVDKDGNNIPNTIQVPKDKIELWNNEMGELLSQTVEVFNVEFKLSEFPESIELQPIVLDGMAVLFTETASSDISLIK